MRFATLVRLREMMIDHRRKQKPEERHQRLSSWYSRRVGDCAVAQVNHTVSYASVCTGQARHTGARGWG